MQVRNEIAVVQDNNFNMFSLTYPSKIKAGHVTTNLKHLTFGLHTV